MTEAERGAGQRRSWVRRLADAPTWVLAAVILVVLAAVGGGVLLVDAARAPTHAKDACREAIEDRLKAPATAEFSGEVVEDGQGEGEYVVSGDVDSENGFGAMIRNRYSCKVRDSGSWYVHDVTFAER